MQLRGTLEGDAEREGRGRLLARSCCPGLSITTSQIPHLACAVSKSLAEAVLRGRDVQPRSLTNDATLVLHAKPPRTPGSSLLGARSLRGPAAAWLARKTLRFALSGRAGRVAGPLAAARAALSRPPPCAALRPSPSPRPSPTVPPLGWLLPGLQGARGREMRSSSGGVGRGGPSGCPPRGSGHSA